MGAWIFSSDAKATLLELVHSAIRTEVTVSRMTERGFDPFFVVLGNHGDKDGVTPGSPICWVSLVFPTPGRSARRNCTTTCVHGEAT